MWKKILVERYIRILVSYLCKEYKQYHFMISSTIFYFWTQFIFEFWRWLYFFLGLWDFFSFVFEIFFLIDVILASLFQRALVNIENTFFFGKFSNCWVLIPKFFLNSHPISPSYSFFIYLTQIREFMDREGLYIGFPLKSLNFSSDIGTYFFGLRLCCSCCWIDRKGLPLLTIPSFQPGEKRV